MAEQADEKAQQFCGRGICAAEAGHEGTCAEASGWDEDWTPATVRALAAVDKMVERLRASLGHSADHTPRAEQGAESEETS